MRSIKIKLFTNIAFRMIPGIIPGRSGCGAVRLAHSVRDGEAAGSNPVIPTIYPTFPYHPTLQY